MRRHINSQWDLPSENDGLTWQHAQIAVLMDIRDELQRLNRIMTCPNTLNIPFKLDKIVRNTTPKKRAKAKTKPRR